MSFSSTVRGFVLLAATALTFAAPAQAEETSFTKPKINGVRLDWCKIWGDKCGKPAADAFCKLHEFAGASAYAQDKAPGAKTKVFSGGQICDSDNCTGFKSITCKSESVQIDSDGAAEDDEIAQQGGDGLPAQNPNGDNTPGQDDGDDEAPPSTMTQDLGGVVQGELSAVAFKDNGQARVAVFGKGGDGKLWWQAGDGNGKWFGWVQAGTKTMSVSPSCASSSHGVTCNYIGAGDYVWSISFINGKWTQHEKTDGLSKASPAAASYLDEEGKTNVIVFVKDQLGRLVANWKNKDPDTDFWVWHGWTPTNGKIAGTPACRQAGPNSATIYCAAKSSDGSTVVHKLQGATYQSAKNLGGSTSFRPQIVAGSLSPGVRVLVRGDDGMVWSRENLKGVWTPWKGTSIKTNKGPACAIQPGSATDWCFTAGPSGNVIATGFKSENVFQ